MRLKGIDGVALSADELASASRFFRDLGLGIVSESHDGVSLTTRDDTCVNVCSSSTVGATKTALLEITWGADDSRTVNEIATELSNDRPVRRDEDGTIHSIDNDGFGIAFRVSRRGSPPTTPNRLNIYGGHSGRPVNGRINFCEEIRPAAIAHVVLFSTDVAKATSFYVDRLGFRITDCFAKGLGTFLRSSDSGYHHDLFITQGDAPQLHHIAFAVADFNDVILAGQALLQKGWKSSHGPGRHVIGSNYFWYFNSPCGPMELTADIDRADDDWVAGEWEPLPQNTMAWSLDCRQLPDGRPIVPEAVAQFQASINSEHALPDGSLAMRGSP